MALKGKKLMYKYDNIFILPQLEFNCWGEFLPLIEEVIIKSNINLIISTNQLNLDIVKKLLNDTMHEYKYIEKDMNFEWTNPILHAPYLCFKFLSSLNSIKNIYSLSIGGDIFFAMYSKHIGYKFLETNFNLINACTTLKKNFLIAKYIENINGLILNDIEEFNIKYSCKISSDLLNFIPTTTFKNNSDSINEILYMGPLNLHLGFKIFIVTLKEILSKENIKLRVVFVNTNLDKNIDDEIDVLKSLGNNNFEFEILNLYTLISERNRLKPSIAICSKNSYIFLIEKYFPTLHIIGVKYLEGFIPCNRESTTPNLLLKSIIKRHNYSSLSSISFDFNKNYQNNKEFKLDNEPLVSVCITHFERPENIITAFKSIKNQTYKNIEIFIADDGSSSEISLKRLNELESEVVNERKIEVIYGENSYLGASRNRVIDKANGKYIFYMDDDNIAMEREIEEFVYIAERNNASFVGSSLAVFHSNNPAPELNSIDGIFSCLGSIYSGGLLANNYSDANGLYLKKDLVEFNGFSTEYGLGYEDWELFHKMAMNDKKLIVIPDPFFYYRVNIQDSMARTHTSDEINLLRILRHSKNIASDMLFLKYDRGF